jgi:hypothetical protein
VTVIPPPVTAVPPISNDNAALAVVIAFLIDVKILIILPSSGTGTKVDPAELMSVILDVKK